MQVTKFFHSCLAIEHEGLSVILDPGNYSIGYLDANDVPKLDYLLITHEHADHCDLPLVRSLMTKFPDAHLITTNSVKTLLEREGIHAMTQGDMHVVVSPVTHEKIWMGNPVENTLFTIFGKLTHPGDSLSFQQTAEVLALPISGPWANTTQAVDLATRLKPKVIIPIHDWHWKDEVRKSMHQRLREHFMPLGIDFRPLELGDIIEV